MCDNISKKSNSLSTSSHLPILSHTDLQISSIESALLLGTTFSDLNRFLAVSLPFVPLARERFIDPHSFGICMRDVVDAASLEGGLGAIGLISDMLLVPVYCSVCKGTYASFSIFFSCFKDVLDAELGCHAFHVHNIPTGSGRCYV